MIFNVSVLCYIVFMEPTRRNAVLLGIGAILIIIGTVMLIVIPSKTREGARSPDVTSGGANTPSPVSPSHTTD